MLFRSPHRLRTETPVTTWIFYIILAVGIIGRIVLIFTPFFQPNSDNSVVYLEAVHISHGQWQTFYWGQSYGGTLLQIISAAIMVVAGPHFAIVSVVSTLFWAAAAWFVRGIARDLFGTRTGDVAGALFWLPGIGAVTLSMLDPGFYGPTLALALGITWLVTRGVFAKSYATFAIAGVMFGLVFWEATMGAALAAPFMVWLFLRQLSWRHWLVGIAGVLVGAAPWWTYLLRPGGHAVLTPHGNHLYWANFKILATQVMPLAFWTDGTNYWPRYATAFTVVVGTVVVVFFIVAAIRRNLGAVLLVVGGGLAYSSIAIGTGALLYKEEWRYAMFVLPVMAVAFAWLFTLWRPAAYLGFAAALALTVVPAASRVHYQYATGATRWQDDTTQVGAFLDQHGVKAGLADYWFAYRYDAAAHEKTVFASLPSMHDRYQPYDAAAQKAVPSAVIVYAGLNNDKILEKDVNANVTRTVIGRWAVYYLPKGLSSLGTVPWAPEPDLWVSLQLPNIND